MRIFPIARGILSHTDEKPMTAIAGKCVSASTEEVNRD